MPYANSTAGSISSATAKIFVDTPKCDCSAATTSSCHAGSPWPPHSTGHDRPANPASLSFRCHARVTSRACSSSARYSSSVDALTMWIVEKSSGEPLAGAFASNHACTSRVNSSARLRHAMPSSFSTRAALCRRNLGHTSGLNPTAGNSPKMRSSDRPIGKYPP